MKIDSCNNTYTGYGYLTICTDNEVFILTFRPFPEWRNLWLNTLLTQRYTGWRKLRVIVTPMFNFYHYTDYQGICNVEMD